LYFAEAVEYMRPTLQLLTNRCITDLDPNIHPLRTFTLHHFGDLRNHTEGHETYPLDRLSLLISLSIFPVTKQAEFWAAVFCSRNTSQLLISRHMRAMSCLKVSQIPVPILFSLAKGKVFVCMMAGRALRERQQSGDFETKHVRVP
jgi:hypothetical protein